MDLIRTTKASKVAVKKSDIESVQFNFQILNDGLIADLTGATVQLAIKKPSLLTVFEDCIITSPANGECEVVLSNQSYLEVGTHIGELYVTQNAELAISNSFEYSSLDAIMTDSSLQSTNDWQAIHDLLLEGEGRPLLGTGSPNGIVPSEYKGQLFLDTIGNSIYFATGESVNDSWLPLGGGTGEGGGVVYWNDVLLKPDSFIPSVHAHLWADITDAPTTMTPTAHTHDWATEITGKPSTFTPSTHAHTIADITGLTAELDSKLEAIPAEYLTESEADAKYGLIGEGGGGIEPPKSGAIDPSGAPDYLGQTYVNTTSGEAFVATTMLGDWQSISMDELGGGAEIVTWDSVTGKPATFTPSAHVHDIADINTLSTVLTGKSDTNHTHAYSSLTAIPASFTPSAHTHTKANITDFAHTHAIADVTNLSTTLTGKSDTDHTHTYASLTSVPATFTPTAHTHVKADITDFAHNHPMSEVTGLTTALDGKADDADLTGKANSVDVYTKLETYNKTEVDDIVTGITEGGGTVVVDNLTSTSPTSALSANQGRILDIALDEKVTNVNGVTSIWEGTRAEYDAITTKNPATIYITTDETGVGAVSPVFKVTSNTVQSFSANVMTKVVYDVLNTNIGGGMDLANDQFVCPIAGNYMIYAQMYVISVSSGSRHIIQYNVNGTSVGWLQNIVAPSAGDFFVNAYSLMPLAVNDTVEILFRPSEAKTTNFNYFYGYLV